jgi:hypothetical protein
VTEETQIEPEFETAPEAEIVAVQHSDLNLPFVITIVSLLVWFGFQTFQLMRERSNLTFVKANQDSAIQESQKVQTQFQSIITKTSELANQGHAGARMVMDQLQRQGLALAPESKPESKPETKPEAKSITPDAKSIK